MYKHVYISTDWNNNNARLSAFIVKQNRHEIDDLIFTVNGARLRAVTSQAYRSPYIIKICKKNQNFVNLCLRDIILIRYACIHITRSIHNLDIICTHITSEIGLDKSVKSWNKDLRSFVPIRILNQDSGKSSSSY